MSETAFEKAYLRRSYAKKDMSWGEFWFWVAMGFVVLIFATVMTFGPFPAPTHAHADETSAAQQQQSDVDIAHASDKQACALVKKGVPTNGTPTQIQDYCNKYGK